MEEITAEQINEQYKQAEPLVFQDEGEALEIVEGEVPETEELTEEEA